MAVCEPVRAGVAFLAPRVHAMRSLTRAFVALVFGVLLALEAILYAGLVNAHAQRPVGSDLLSFHGSALQVRMGQTPYWPVPSKVPEGHPCHKHSQAQLDLISTLPEQRDLKLELLCRPANLNPPFFSVLLAPLTVLDIASFHRLWAWLSVISSLIAVWLVLRELGFVDRGARRRAFETWLITSAAMYLWFPSWANFLFGQVSFILMLPLVLFWRAMRQGRDTQAGLYLGLLMGIKLFFGLFLVSLLLARRWRVLATALACLLLTVLIGLYPVGMQAYRDYMAGLGQMDWAASNLNGSWQAYVSRFLGGSRNVPMWDAPTVARWLTWGGQLVLGCALLVTIGRASLVRAADGDAGLPCSARRMTHTDVVFALTMPAMLLMSPLAWVYYYSWLILPAALIWRWGNTHPRKVTIRLLLLLLWAMVAAPRAFLGAWQVNEPLTWLLDWGFYTYALLGLFMLAVWLGPRAQNVVLARAP